MDIAEARKTLGLTQAELAAKLGINQATISRMEAGVLAVEPRTVLAMKALLTGVGDAAA